MLGRCLIIHAAMRLDFIVFLSPGFEKFLCLLQCRKPMFIQAFVAELSIEAFTEGILYVDFTARDDGLKAYVSVSTAICGS